MVRRETEKTDGRKYRRSRYEIRKTRERAMPKSSVPDSMLKIPADAITPSDQTFKRTPPTPQSESSVDPGVNKVSEDRKDKSNQTQNTNTLFCGSSFKDI